MFKSFGFSQTTANVSGVQGVKFNGSIAGLFETAYIIERGGKVYKLQLTYQEARINPKLEKEFSDMVASFRINQ